MMIVKKISMIETIRRMTDSIFMKADLYGEDDACSSPSFQAKSSALFLNCEDKPRNEEGNFKVSGFTSKGLVPQYIR